MVIFARRRGKVRVCLTSLEVTVSVVMFLAVMAVMLVRMASREDPRSYVLLEDEGDVADIDATFGLRNLCFMDVKVLCFDVDDRVQFIPLGGLLPKDAVLPRNAWKSFALRIESLIW